MGQCGKYFLKKDEQFMEFIMINFKTSYDVLCFSFRSNQISHKKEGKDLTFDILCDLLIKEQEKLLEEGNIFGKN